eukprot:gene6257-6076_t
MMMASSVPDVLAVRAADQARRTSSQGRMPVDPGGVSAPLSWFVGP